MGWSTWCTCRCLICFDMSAGVDPSLLPLQWSHYDIKHSNRAHKWKLGKHVLVMAATQIKPDTDNCKQPKFN